MDVYDHPPVILMMYRVPKITVHNLFSSLYSDRVLCPAVPSVRSAPDAGVDQTRRHVAEEGGHFTSGLLMLLRITGALLSTVA